MNNKITVPANVNIEYDPVDMTGVAPEAMKEVSEAISPADTIMAPKDSPLALKKMNDGEKQSLVERLNREDHSVISTILRSQDQRLRALEVTLGVVAESLQNLEATLGKTNLARIIPSDELPPSAQYALDQLNAESQEEEE